MSTSRRTVLRTAGAALAAPLAWPLLQGGPALAAGAPRPAVDGPIRGVDVSSLPKAEDLGAVYRRADGSTADALTILAENGANWVRLKVWVNSPDGYHDAARVCAVARRAAALGLRTLVDFHYSDSWADPGQQHKPAAWAGLDAAGLDRAVADHTGAVLGALVDQGTPADLVQLGNEINAGMLWPDGSTDDFDRLAQLLTVAARAAAEASPGTARALHLAEGGDNGAFRWWFDNAVAREVPFEVIALSFYGYWHGTLGELEHNLHDLVARYDRDVVVVETAYPFRLGSDDDHEDIIGEESQLVAGYPATPEGQRRWLADLGAVVDGVPDGRGLGVFYWEPAWTAVPGNGWDPADPASGNAWENQALFDYTGRVLPAAGW
ncbi:glycosyl hydrolase 53 family protein [Streptomyces sp. DSM 44915]|uniref:Arabinogalactan endo-beta-1,4-galactanase n=1 Tax=Streptomyces chisholmiae TaxID=3075540 RepID=A0ABU2JJR6_9ACTN|nr:glycosyl hydrolase 53 family protein [Streptomyces sp. DSM 44915]MDT0265162.1 glycosyl hydrolase 53 family protein [Streptomyces sp. DSM 44915]